jgi:hypothetical protein
MVIRKVHLSLKAINIIEHLTKDRVIDKGTLRITLSLVRCSVILITLNNKGSIRMTQSLVRCSVILITLNDKGTIRPRIGSYVWYSCH